MAGAACSESGHRSNRNVGSGHLQGFSYNLGPGSYASFNLPSTQTNFHQTVSNPIFPLPVIPQSLTLEPVPIFLNQNNVHAQIPPNLSPFLQHSEHETPPQQITFPQSIHPSHQSHPLKLNPHPQTSHPSQPIHLSHQIESPQPINFLQQSHPTQAINPTQQRHPLEAIHHPHPVHPPPPIDFNQHSHLPQPLHHPQEIRPPQPPPLLPVSSPPLTMNGPISLHNYQLPQPGPVQVLNPFTIFSEAHNQPASVHSFQTGFVDQPHVHHPPNGNPSPHPHLPVVTTPSLFHPSRPDRIPPHLHPAHHPVPDLHLEPLPVYLPPSPSHQPSEPSIAIGYDPFEFAKTINQTDSSPISPPKTPSPPQAFQPNNLPPVLIPFPNPPTLFPVASLSPLPPLPPAFPQYDDYGNPDNFPEYDAVPPNLLSLIPSFIPLRLTQRGRNNQNSQLSRTISGTKLDSKAQQPRISINKPNETGSKFLFTSNRDLGVLTAQRLKRKNVKGSKKMLNSHGGPVNMLDISERCGKHVHEDNINLLNDKFAACKELLGSCGLNQNNTKAITEYGTCLNKNYPETVTLNLGRTLSSGHGSVSFHSDKDCTNFVHQFFPSCGKYLLTCNQVEQDSNAAALILGCLFGQYPSLMVPLLTVEQDLSREERV